jgi:RNA polymerase sigma factor (sigma-70 family)
MQDASFCEQVGPLRVVAMSSPTLTYNASNNPLGPALSPADRPTSFAYQSQATPLHHATDPAGGLYSFVYDDGQGHLKRLVAPSNAVTSMAHCSHMGIVQPSNSSTSLAWDEARRIAQPAETRVTVISALDAVVDLAPARKHDRLDENLLARLDELLADPNTSVDAFCEFLTEKDERCASIWNRLCTKAAHDFGVDRKTVSDRAREALKHSLEENGAHDWLREHRKGFVAWFSRTAKNHVRNSRRTEVRCEGRINKIGECLRESRSVEHLCVTAADPSIAMDFIQALEKMPQELQAVFLRRYKSRLVGWDKDGAEIYKSLSDLEIAGELGISVPTVKRRWAEAIKYLQRRLPDLRIKRKH